MSDTEKAMVNPLIVMREEFDDWAILFDPDSGHAFGLNPVGVLVWKCLDGHHTIKDIVIELKEKCENTPEDTAAQVQEFINDLVEKGMAGFLIQ